MRLFVDRSRDERCCCATGATRRRAEKSRLGSRRPELRGKSMRENAHSSDRRAPHKTSQNNTVQYSQDSNTGNAIDASRLYSSVMEVRTVLKQTGQLSKRRPQLGSCSLQVLGALNLKIDVLRCTRSNLVRACANASRRVIPYRTL